MVFRDQPCTKSIITIFRCSPYSNRHRRFSEIFRKEQKRHFAGGAVALGSAHSSFSFVGSLSMKFLVLPFLRQSNLPLFAPFLCKVGIWTLPHFCVKHKKTNEGLEIVRYRSLKERKQSFQDCLILHFLVLRSIFTILYAF
ncbi:hypothetical protein IGJ28_001123 [Enterococcus sp. AZ091]